MANCQMHRLEEVLDDHNVKDIGGHDGIVGVCGGLVRPTEQAGIFVGIITGERAPCCGQPRIPAPVLHVKASRHK